MIQKGTGSSKRLGCDQRLWNDRQGRCHLLTPTAVIRIDEAGEMPAAFKDQKLIVTGGYSNSLARLRNFARPRCYWFTVFREPVARLVSSYLYCGGGGNTLLNSSKISRDPLCASGVLAARDTTIEGWAKHWGNYLLRELLLHPDLSPSPIAGVVAAELRRTPALKESTKGLLYGARAIWYLQKLALKGADDPRTPAGAASLAAVSHRLGSSNESNRYFDTIGVLENMTSTLEHFDHVMPLSHKWAAMANRHHVTHGSEKYRALEEDTLRLARQSEIVQAELAGDLHLYQNVVLPLYERQIKSQSSCL